MTSRPVFCPTCNRVHEFQRPPMAERPGMVATWGDFLGLVGTVLIFLTLFLGIPWLVLMWGTP